MSRRIVPTSTVTAGDVISDALPRRPGVLANSIAAVQRGPAMCRDAQCLGERTGKCNLTPVIPTCSEARQPACRGSIEADAVVITLPRCHRPLNPRAVRRASRLLTRLVARQRNRAARMLRTSIPTLAERTRFIVSEMAGRRPIQMKAGRLGLTMDVRVNKYHDSSGWSTRAPLEAADLVGNPSAGSGCSRTSSGGDMRVIPRKGQGGTSYRGKGKGVVGDRAMCHTARGMAPSTP